MIDVSRAGSKALLGGAFAAVLLAPLAMIAGLMRMGAPGGVVILADVLGFVAMSLLALQVFSSGRWPSTTRTFGLRRVLSAHRLAGVAIVVLVALHLVLLLVDEPGRLGLLDFLTAPARARAAVLATACLLVLAVTSALRSRLRLRYERWRALHLGATTVALVAAFAHVVLVDDFTALPAVRWTMLALLLGAAVALYWTRFVRPYSSALRPYRVRAVGRERGGAVTVELEAAGHAGLAMGPGQFAWIRAGGGLYGMQEHPFTVSSGSLRRDRVAFTVKALGDFTGSVSGLAAGTPVLVDGPHGEAIDLHASRRGQLLLAAGIGITPAMSLLRTAAAGGWRRRLLLIYGSRDWDEVIFREELCELEAEMPNLTVVHVLSRPVRGWAGERGRIGEEHLRRHLPADLSGWRALICGPEGMVLDSKVALRRLGMRSAAIQAEGFQ